MGLRGLRGHHSCSWLMAGQWPPVALSSSKPFLLHLECDSSYAISHSSLFKHSFKLPAHACSLYCIKDWKFFLVTQFVNTRSCQQKKKGDQRIAGNSYLLPDSKLNCCWSSVLAAPHLVLLSALQLQRTLQLQTDNLITRKEDSPQLL